MEFYVTIELGNDAMQTDADIADALSNIIDKLDRNHGPVDDLHGVVLDLNGNTVGEWGTRPS